MNATTQEVNQMQPATPVRSIEQRLAALKRANHIRSHRARLKREVASGRRHVAAVLVADDPLLDTMKVWDLLIAQPKRGRVKVNNLLTRLRISPSKTVGGLSARQRNELLEYLS